MPDEQQFDLHQQVYSCLFYNALAGRDPPWRYALAIDGAPRPQRYETEYEMYRDALGFINDDDDDEIKEVTALGYAKNGNLVWLHTLARKGGELCPE